jgi:hypothetical protein
MHFSHIHYSGVKLPSKFSGNEKEWGRPLVSKEPQDRGPMYDHPGESFGISDGDTFPKLKF